MDPAQRPEQLAARDSAFDAVYAVFAPPLRRYLARLCGDADLAEDLLQETFRKAFLALPRQSPDLALRPWLYAIATNAARSHARAAYWRRVRTLGDADLAVVDERAGVEDRLVAADLVRRALARLKPDDATLLLLRWQEGFSNDEVAAILRISPDALKKRLYRARKAFGAAYAREAADPKGDSHA